MVSQRTTVLGLLATVAAAYPGEAAAPACSAVTYVQSGIPVWQPTADPVWPVWSSSSSKSSSSSTGTWDPWTSTTTKSVTKSATNTYAGWGSVPTVSSSSTSTSTWTGSYTQSNGGGFYTESSSSTPTSTSASATPTPTGDNCQYNIFDNVSTVHGGGDINFFSANPNEQIDSFDDCIALCDDNSDCQAAFYINDPSLASDTADYKICYQVQNLPQPTGTGVAHIAYKASCTAAAPSAYNSNL